MKISKGIWYMLIATFTFALMQVCVKFVSHIPPIEVIFFRSVISLLMSYAFLAKAKISIWGTNKPILVLRGVTGAIALTMYFMLIQQVPLAAASTMQYIAPIFTSILGIFIVREKVALKQFLYFGISLLGIFLIQGFDTRVSFFHLSLGLGSALFTGFAYNFVRKLKTSEHPLVIIFYFPLVTLPFAGLYSVFNWVTPTGWDWGVLLLVGIFTQIAQYFMTLSYQSEELSKVSVINYLGILFSLLFGYFIFDENYNHYAYIGMVLVLTGVMLNLWFKRMR